MGLNNFTQFISSIAGYWCIPPHVSYIGERIERSFTNNINIPRLLMISMPPRSLKTTIATNYLPCWIANNFKNQNIILTGYSKRLLNENYNVIKKQYELCPKLFHFNPDILNRIYTISIGESIMSIPNYNVLILDDYYKNEEAANSLIYRTKVFEWFRHLIFYKRTSVINPFVLIMSSRWCVNDLIGQVFNIISINGIRFLADYINIPAIKNNNTYWDKYSVKQLLEIKKTIGEKLFNALYLGDFSETKI